MQDPTVSQRPPSRGPYNQNIFGGTIGGPIRRDKVFFFADFQGTKQTIGTVNIAQAQTAADKTGNVADMMSIFAYEWSVVGNGWAGVLSKRLGYAVTAGEPYLILPGKNPAPCTSTSQCVFPNAVIPSKAWSPVVSHLFTYMPAPNTIRSQWFTRLSEHFRSNTLSDYKGAGRVDENTRFGTLFGYYFMDNDALATHMQAARPEDSPQRRRGARRWRISA